MANTGISLPRISASEIDIKSIREGSYLLFYNLDNGDALSSINHKGEVIVSQNIPFATASGEFTKLAENGTETITVYTDGTPKLVFLTSALETVSLSVNPLTETAPSASLPYPTIWEWAIVGENTMAEPSTITYFAGYILFTLFYYKTKGSFCSERMATSKVLCCY